ncbi:MAG: hypothetical protein Q8P18_06775 [Pseudomonadota bacterium]|nr:hypothetical protein [Pseudomonadota bacterium]
MATSGGKANLDEKLVVLFIAGCAMLTYPLLAIADVDALIGHVPVLWIWIFGVWSSVVLSLAVLLEGG